MYTTLSLLLCSLTYSNPHETPEAESVHSELKSPPTSHATRTDAHQSAEPHNGSKDKEVATHSAADHAANLDTPTAEPHSSSLPSPNDRHPTTRKDSKHSEPGHGVPQPHQPSRPKGVLCGLLPSKTLTWSAKQGPLVLVGTVIVGPGTTLTIRAGTEIRIGAHDSCPDSGASSNNGRSVALIVRGGTLRIDGSPEKPVRFTPLAQGKGFLWDGIRIEKANRDANAWLRWFEISRATKGVSILAGAGRIEHAVIEDCGIGIASLMGASPTITHSVISGSTISGIASSRSATRLISSMVLNSTGDGVRFDGVGLSEIKTSCFWGLRGSGIVRGPAGLGTWAGDSLADKFGNWYRDPVMRESPEHARLLGAMTDSLAKQPWWKPRRLPENPAGTGRWSLSPFSPLIDRGETRFCSDQDGSKWDIGLWGGS